MKTDAKAVRIDLKSFAPPQMRAFHMSWFAFFLCFFGWFGIAPLMAVVRDELLLSKTQVGNTIIASVAATIVARPIFGWLCDRFGPRRTYGWLLLLGAFPVATIGLANSYETLLLFRLVIGVVGASFVVTQFHTSVMFAPNCVGTANATTAGWGNVGGGATQLLMPLLLTLMLSVGVGDYWSWRLAMVIPGVAMFVMGILYMRWTVDSPSGNRTATSKKSESTLRVAAADYRVWALAVIYAACFGVELTMHNIAAMYFFDNFQLSLQSAGLAAASFGLLNLFARTLGGFLADRCGIRFGLRGRVMFLALALLGEALALMLFSRMTALPLAIGSLMLFGLCVQMANGATFSLVPLINRKAIGSVAGIVGAGGNAGAVAAGFLFRSESLSTATALLIIAVAVMAASGVALLIRFSSKDEQNARAEMEASLARRAGMIAS